MTKRTFTRGQTQILYRFLPEAIFAHDDYGLCKVTEVTIEDGGAINQSALFDTLSDTLSQWSREEFRNKFPDPRDKSKLRAYKYGQPREVLFDPFPTILQCKKCKIVVDYSKLKKKGISPGKCTRSGCGGRFEQLGYVEAHNCGRMKEIHLGSGCSKHGLGHIRFHDTGRAQSSRWVCGICNENNKMRMTPCACEYSNAVDELNRSKYEKFLRVYPTSEPGLYNPHVVAFINFPEEEERKLSFGTNITCLLLARVWGLLDKSVLSIVDERKKFTHGGAEIDNKYDEIRKALEAVDPNNPALKEFMEKTKNPPGESEISRVKELLVGRLDLAGAPSRKLVEHVALKDKMNLTNVDTIGGRLTTRERNIEGENYIQKAQKTFKLLGLRDAFIINNFPIALAALGYTRVTKDTKISSFNPFTVGEDGKIPLFVIPTETEGLWFHLDPKRVLCWLIDNHLLTGNPTSHDEEAWAKLHKGALGPILNQSPELPPPSHAVNLLVHSMSHVFLRCVEWSGFGSSSIGEYLMPGTLSFAIYANRFTESKIGGLTTLFEQRLSLWLNDAYQSGRSCIYDPLCDEDGGTCVGCLHREFNCPLFNNELSRASLYGGHLPPKGGLGMRKIEKGYWA